MGSKTKKVWQVDADGLITEVIELSEAFGDYREGNWIIPHLCIEKEPPADKEGYILRWNGSKWEYAKVELVDDVPETGAEFFWTPERLLSRLNGEFETEKAELLSAFMTAQIKNNATLQQEIKDDLIELETEYKKNAALINKGGSPWEDTKDV